MENCESQCLLRNENQEQLLKAIENDRLRIATEISQLSTHVPKDNDDDEFDEGVPYSQTLQGNVNFGNNINSDKL